MKSERKFMPTRVVMSLNELKDDTDTEEKKRIRWEMGRLLGHAIASRIEEIRETRGRIRLVSIDRPKFDLGLIDFPELSRLNVLTQKGILALDMFTIKETIGESEGWDLFKSGNLKYPHIPPLAELLRQGSYFREHGHKVNEMLLLSLFWDEDSGLGEDPQDPKAISITGTYTPLNPEQRGKMNEIIQVGRSRSALNDVLRAFGLGPKLDK